MWTDPIVSEVRKAGEELARKADGDLHTFFSNMRSAQKQYAERLTRLKDMKQKKFHEGANDSGSSQQPTITG